MSLSYEHATPAELVSQPNVSPQGSMPMPQMPVMGGMMGAMSDMAPAMGQMPTGMSSMETPMMGPEAATAPPAALAPPKEDQSKKVLQYVIGWRDRLKQQRQDKLGVWNACWELYRGQEDWSDKEDWQTKIVLPKTWASVKQATNVIKRFLLSSKHPWTVESINPDDLVTVVRSGQITDLSMAMAEKAKYVQEFTVGLECGFIMGLGIWKLWWGYTPRVTTKVQVVQGPNGPVKQLVRQEIQDGRPYIRAVDPYTFYWLPGSKLNRWVGTIEETEISKWELMDLAQRGVFDPEQIKKLSGMRIGENQKQSNMRFGELQEPQDASGPGKGTETIKLTEFYGPVLVDGEMVEPNGHVVVANDSELLLPGDGYKRNGFWHEKAPYIAFSPLGLPFRTEGVGLVEQVIQINKALNKLANLSVDTLLFRLLPLFEVIPEVFENPEDLESGMYPGKMYRRNFQQIGQPGMTPIKFEDVSPGSVQVAAMLDRAHQEGALVSEIQQGIPRYRGVQTATEIDAKMESQNSFFGSLASDIEDQALAPMIEMLVDLVLQFIDTMNDPQVASILGVGVDALRGMSREDLIEMVQGDYKIKVTGISGQLDKAEMLQNLVQFMNILGQNSEAWMPYINQDALLRRILESFRPVLHDIEQIVADPATAEAAKAAANSQAMTPDMLRLLPQLVDMAHRQELDQQKQAQEAQAAQMQQVHMMMEMQKAQNELQMQQAEIGLRLAEMEHEKAMAKTIAAKPVATSQT